MTPDPLAAVRGVLHAVLLSLPLWAVLFGFVAAIYFNVHV